MEREPLLDGPGGGDGGDKHKHKHKHKHSRHHRDRDGGGGSGERRHRRRDKPKRPKAYITVESSLPPPASPLWDRVGLWRVILGAAAVALMSGTPNAFTALQDVSVARGVCVSRGSAGERFVRAR